MSHAGSAEPPALLDSYLALSHVGPAEAAGPLAPLAGEAYEETPRVHVARLVAGGWHVFLRPDLPESVRLALSELPPAALFSDYARVANILDRRAPDAPPPYGLSDGLWIGRTLLFPEDATWPSLDDVVALPPGVDYCGALAPAEQRPAQATIAEPPPPPDVFPGEQFAVVVDGVVASICESARESEVAAEAWVRTIPTASRRGYATRVTAAWARDVLRRGKTPFYSHARENRASAGVARALGLIPFLDDVGYL